MNIKKLFRRIRKTIKLLPYKGAGVALFKKANGEYQVLMGLRKHWPIGWSFPGGKYDEIDKKSLFKTALRELKEETEIDLKKSVKEETAVISHFILPFFEWKTFMYEVDSSFPVPSWWDPYEFSDMKFIPLCEFGKYKPVLGVKIEVNKFLKNISKLRKQK